MVLGQLGLKVNLDKSELVPVGKVSNVEGLSDILGCRVSKLPMTYRLNCQGERCVECCYRENGETVGWIKKNVFL